MIRRSLFAVSVAALAGCAPSTPPAPSPAPTAAEAPAPPLREGTDFRVYRSDGAPSSVAELVAAMGEADAVLVGEEHDDVVTHRVQLLLLAEAWRARGDRDVVLSLEMFERDVQPILDEYLDDLISESHFRASARPWDNYERDYRPLVEFAKAHELAVVAANAPRRYVNRASRLGAESLRALPDEAHRWLPPLPYPGASEAYQSEWDALMGEAAAHMAGSPLDGQTLWDASMGHSVAEVLDRTPEALVLHMAGGFHVENHTGIPETLVHYRPWTRVLTVAARPVADPSVFEPDHEGRGDFVVLTRDLGPS